MAETADFRVEERQDLSRLVGQVRRHAWIVAISVIIFAILAFIAAMTLPRRYTAEAQLDYTPPATGVAPGQTISDAARDARIDSQVQTMKSLTVATGVVDRLHLKDDPELVEEARKLVGPQSDQRQAVAAALLNKLSAARVGTTTLFNVAYTDENPLRATNFANAFVDSFLANEMSSKVQQLSDSNVRLNQRIQDQERLVEQADAAVARYRLQHNLLGDPDVASTDQELMQIRTGLASAQADAAEAASRTAAANRSTVLGGGNGSSTITLSTLTGQRAEVARRLAALTSRYGDKYPAIVDAQKELTAIDAQIAKEMSSLSRTAGAESSASSSRASSLSRSLSSAQSRVASEVATSVQLADLQRQAKSAADVYQQLLAIGVQQSTEKTLTRPDTRVASTATVPLIPSYPNKPLIMFLGALAGFAVGVGIAFLRERWTQGLDSVDDIERLLDVDYFNSIPTAQSSIEAPKTSDPLEAVLLHPLSAYVESFRNLATSLSFAARPKTGKVLGITSALPREGKTTTSMSIARVLAKGGSSVILLDCDLRRRSVTQLAAPNAEVGLGEVVVGDATLQAALVKDETGLMILPIAPHVDTSPKIFQSDGFDTLIAHLRQNFEYIVIDTAPLLAVADTRVLLHHFDSFALLVHWRKTPLRAVRAALHQVSSVGGAVSGVALTMVNAKVQAQSGYGDPSYYTGYVKSYETAE